MPFGTELDEAGGARFRLWAPGARTVALRLEAPGPPRQVAMRKEAEGWFRAEVPEVGPGARYRFRIDAGDPVPDLASRFQPDGVHAASEVIDPRAFEWTDEDWRGLPWEEAVIYELHVGTFTPTGGFRGLVGHLDHLVDLGATALELMPIAECPGRRNWGYDGVYPFAPEECYGRPEDLKTLVQAAHQRGVMVFLDVVYNHFGPEGNYLRRYAPSFFNERYQTPWGAAVNFDGPASRTVRDFFIHNALYWVEEYHLDGLRLDAVHEVYDRSSPDILTELAGAVRERIGDRNVHLILENDRNEARRLERSEDGAARGFVAQWNDDLHHTLHVILTGEHEGYYVDYADRPIRQLGRCLAEGFAYQGAFSRFRSGRPRGEPSAHLAPTAFVSFLQNHDQVGNRAFGERIARLTEPDALRAALAIVLLAPPPPLLFMGEEWGCEQPFPFFCDFEDDLAASVREGRRREFARFPAFQEEAARERIPDPCAGDVFESAVLRWEDLERDPHREWLAYYRRLLDLRRREITPRLAGIPGGAGAFSEIGEAAVQVTWDLRDGAQLRLVAHLSPQPLSGVPTGLGNRALFVTHEALPEMLERGEMPPWSAAWSLQETPAAECQ